MRLTNSGPDGRAAANSQPQSYDRHQHHGTVAADVPAPVGAAQHQQNQTVDSGNSRPTNAVHDQPPPSSSDMISELDAAHAMDFGVKFIGGLDAMPGTVTRVQPTAQPTAETTTREPPQPHWQQPYLQSHDPAAAEQQKPPVEPLGYAEKRQREEAGRQEDDHDEAECHPFWLSWRDIFLGIWLIVIGLLKIPLVIGDGMGKALHHTPELYGDKTVRKWPRVTGFPHGCVAGCLGLCYGLYDGLTDWITLPYKAVRDGGGSQGCLKGLLQGITNIFFKISAELTISSGCFAVVFHPIFGIYKEFCKIKVVVKHERGSHVRDTPPV
ncbi:putative sterol glucosyltransferase [Apiospora rasikravindrae]|uniref:Sterol glucosyltransferase n=1 Tax=Apiospora rasikravindrae TaxID=990691 RepID=A0ABR1S0W7_9PEZI